MGHHGNLVAASGLPDIHIEVPGCHPVCCSGQLLERTENRADQHDRKEHRHHKGCQNHHHARCLQHPHRVLQHLIISAVLGKTPAVQRVDSVIDVTVQTFGIGIFSPVFLYISPSFCLDRLLRGFKIGLRHLPDVLLKHQDRTAGVLIVEGGGDLSQIFLIPVEILQGGTSPGTQVVIHGGAYLVQCVAELYNRGV